MLSLAQITQQVPETRFQVPYGCHRRMRETDRIFQVLMDRYQCERGSAVSSPRARSGRMSCCDEYTFPVRCSQSIVAVCFLTVPRNSVRCMNDRLFPQMDS